MPSTDDQFHSTNNQDFFDLIGREKVLKTVTVSIKFLVDVITGICTISHMLEHVGDPGIYFCRICLEMDEEESIQQLYATL